MKGSAVLRKPGDGGAYTMAKNTFSLVRKEEGAPKPRPEDKIRSPLAAQLLEQDIIKPQSTSSMQSSASQHVGRSH